MTAVTEMTTVLANAMKAEGKAAPANMYLSCARIYVTVYGPKLRTVKAAAKRLGITWTHRGIYVGYDNASGREYMRGEAIAAALSAAGVNAYQHTDED
jgi:hypothetical protein